MTEERQRAMTAFAVLLAVIVLAAATAGCASSVQDDDGSTNASVRDSYLSAYVSGMDCHGWAQDYFNNGTIAWENGDVRRAITDYGNASMMYDMAARSYARMAPYAENPQDREFGNSLAGCTFNLSLAADRFMNAAIALERNETETAYALFEEGQSRVNASEAMLNRSIALTPAWMINMSSG